MPVNLNICQAIARKKYSHCSHVLVWVSVGIRVGVKLKVNMILVRIPFYSGKSSLSDFVPTSLSSFFTGIKTIKLEL